MRMALAVTALLAVSHASYAKKQATNYTIVDLAVATPDLSTLVAALKAADLVDTLSGPGPFTVFAPTNEAFAALPTGALDFLLQPKNKATLVKLLTYHVVAADIPSSQLLGGEGIKTVEGDYVNATVEKSSIMINQAKVTSADNKASNGVVHIIDGVLTYPGFALPGTIVDLAVATPDLSTLVTALKAADLVDTLSGPGPFTVFAPTNKAFAALPAGLLDSLLLPANKATLVKLLTYHVAAADVHAKNILNGERIKTVEGDAVMAAVSNSGIKINQAKVTSADNDASNGVVHIIDAVLTYPGFAPPTPALTDIFALVQQTPGLGILANLLKDANLNGALASKGPYTLFAPTDEVFKALPSNVLNCLPHAKTLAQLLEVHVLAQAVYATSITSRKHEYRTLDRGNELSLQRETDGTIHVGIHNTTVTSADNNATNGVVHVIDNLLRPFNYVFPTSC